jgi:hypothetical protein
MPLTEDGLGVADGIRGTTTLHEPHAPGLDHPDAAPAVVEDGFVPRNSGRPDLYPHAPMHFRGPVTAAPATGRLDVVTAPESDKPAEAPPAMQLAPPRAAQPAPVAAAAVTEP